MPISDAEFDLFLRDGRRSKVILGELDFHYQQVVDPTHGNVETGTVYVADYPFVTEPGDSPASTRYRDCIIAAPGLDQGIDEQTLGGQTTYSSGELLLDNSDGDLDFLLDLILDGMPFRVLLGSPSWAHSDFRNVMTLIMQQASAPRQDQIAVALRDRGLLLNSSLVGASVGGTGPNSAHPLPVVCGFCNNVEAVLIDSIGLVYGAADTAADSITAYDSGYPLDAETPLVAALGAEFTIDTVADTISHASLNLAVDDIVDFITGASMGLISGAAYFVVLTNLDRSFQVSLTRGGAAANLTGQFLPGETVSVNRYPAVDNLTSPATITMAHPPAGRVTVDVNVSLSAASPTVEETRASDVFLHLVVDRAGIDSGDFFGALDSYLLDDDSCDFHLGLAAMDRMNTTDAIDSAALSVNGFWGFDRLSQFVYGRIRPQALGTLPIALELGSDDIDLATLSVMHLQPTYRDARGFFQKAWASQSDGFAGAVSLDRISYLQAGGLFYSTLDPTSTRYEDDPSHYHPTMVASPDFTTLISHPTCATAFAEFETWLTDRREQVLPWLEILTVTTGLWAYALRLGDVVNMTLDRYGLDAGARFQVVRIQTDLTAQTIALRLLRRRVADFSTASYS